MAKQKSGLNLSLLAKHFSDEEAARLLLEKMRWPDGPVCPTCGQKETVYRMMKLASSKKPGRPGLLRCRACRKQFTVTVGTIFEDSHIPLSKWLLAIHLLCSSKKGMSAHQFHRMLGITYKSAWFMAHRLRYAMTQEPIASKLRGIVEADETYIGGRYKKGGGYSAGNLHGGRKGPRMENKIGVVALIERGGRVRAFPMPMITAEGIKKAILENVETSAALMTDESPLYLGIGYRMASHESVKHSVKEYVRGDCHTNTVEGFFSLLKRGITGVYHHVGKGHVGRYVDEFAFRYDTRKLTDDLRAELAVMGSVGKRLTYKQPAGLGETTA
jgi:transposase-like protein